MNWAHEKTHETKNAREEKGGKCGTENIIIIIIII